MFASYAKACLVFAVTFCLLSWQYPTSTFAQEYTEESVGDWIHKKIVSAIEERGTYEDGVWSTLQIDDENFEVQHLEYRDFEFKYNFVTGEQLNKEARLNGALWDCEVVVRIEYRRNAPAPGKYKPWSSNSDGFRFHAREVKDVGVIWYYKGSPNYGDTVSTTVSRHFFDSLFCRFMHPSSSKEAIVNNYATRSLIKNDKRSIGLASFVCLAKAANGQDYEKHLEVAAIMADFSLAGCDRSVADAYKVHTQAWRSNNARDIQATYDLFLEEVRKCRIGVLEHMEPQDEPYDD